MTIVFTMNNLYPIQKKIYIRGNPCFAEFSMHLVGCMDKCMVTEWGEKKGGNVFLRCLNPVHVCNMPPPTEDMRKYILEQLRCLFLQSFMWMVVVHMCAPFVLIKTQLSTQSSSVFLCSSWTQFSSRMTLYWYWNKLTSKNNDNDYWALSINCWSTGPKAKIRFEYFWTPVIVTNAYKSSIKALCCIKPLLFMSSKSALANIWASASSVGTCW